VSRKHEGLFWEGGREREEEAAAKGLLASAIGDGNGPSVGVGEGDKERETEAALAASTRHGDRAGKADWRASEITCPGIAGSAPGTTMDAAARQRTSVAIPTLL